MTNQEKIDIIIAKFLAGEASPEEALWLDDWKREEKDHQVYFEQCLNLSGLVSFRDIDSSKAWKKMEPSLNKEARIIPLTSTRIILRVAASILLITFLGVMAFLMFRDKKPEILAYTAGEKELLVKLNDGTEVLLAPQAELTTINYGENNRVIRLKGDAYFSVVHDGENPMIVDAGKVFVKDIGTKFRIKNSPDTDTVYVHVDEGVVLLFDSIGSQIEIKASGNAMYVRSSKQIMANIKPNNQTTANFIFNNKPLQEVVDELNSKYQANIVIEKDVLKTCTITTRFTNEDLETILLVVTETLGLQFEKNQNGYIIKGEACH